MKVLITRGQYNPANQSVSQSSFNDRYQDEHHINKILKWLFCFFFFYLKISTLSHPEDLKMQLLLLRVHCFSIGACISAWVTSAHALSNIFFSLIYNIWENIFKLPDYPRAQDLIEFILSCKTFSNI